MVGKPRPIVLSNARNLMVKSLKRQKRTEKKSKWTNVTAMGWPNYDGSKCHTVINRPFFEVDKKSVHFDSECHSRKLSHGQSVTVVNCYSGQQILWTFHVGWSVAWSVCGWT